MKRSNTYLNMGLLIATLVFVASSAMALPPPGVPDASSTSALLGFALVGLAAARRFFRR